MNFSEKDSWIIGNSWSIPTNNTKSREPISIEITLGVYKVVGLEGVETATITELNAEFPPLPPLEEAK